MSFSDWASQCLVSKSSLIDSYAWLTSWTCRSGLYHLHQGWSIWSNLLFSAAVTLFRFFLINKHGLLQFHPQRSQLIFRIHQLQSVLTCITRPAINLLKFSQYSITWKIDFNGYLSKKPLNSRSSSSAGPCRMTLPQHKVGRCPRQFQAVTLISCLWRCSGPLLTNMTLRTPCTLAHPLNRFEYSLPWTSTSPSNSVQDLFASKYLNVPFIY